MLNGVEGTAGGWTWRFGKARGEPDPELNPPGPARLGQRAQRSSCRADGR